jgi:hypothetical protein
MKEMPLSSMCLLPRRRILLCQLEGRVHLRVVVADTAPFPAGSFFTHTGTEGQVAASHWAARSVELYGEAPVQRTEQSSSGFPLVAWLEDSPDLSSSPRAGL